MLTGGARPGAASDEPRTALDYLRRATAFLAARGAATPRLDAEVLLASVLGTDRVGVYLRFDQPIEAAEVVGYREAIRRRAGGEPVAYVVGRREFWSLDLAVSPDVLVPRPETELLVERALSCAGDRSRAWRVLDLGTGSGAVAIALATELGAAAVTAVDRSRAAAGVAVRNARAANVAERLHVVVGDWTTALAASARFELVVSNPPYVPSATLATLAPEVQREPRLALDGGVDGLDAYRALVPASAAVLAPGGSLLVEVGDGQADAVAALMASAGLAPDEPARDLAGIARVVAGRRD